MKKFIVLLVAALALSMGAIPVGAVDLLVDAETLHPENFDNTMPAPAFMLKDDGGRDIGEPIAMVKTADGKEITFLGQYTFSSTNGADIAPLTQLKQLCPELFVPDVEYSVIKINDDTPRRIIISQERQSIEFYVEDSIEEIDPAIVSLALSSVANFDF